MTKVRARPLPNVPANRPRCAHVLGLEESAVVTGWTRDDESWAHFVRRVVVRRVTTAEGTRARRRDEIVAERLLALTFDLSERRR